MQATRPGTAGFRTINADGPVELSGSGTRLPSAQIRHSGLTRLVINKSPTGVLQDRGFSLLGQSIVALSATTLVNFGPRIAEELNVIGSTAVRPR